MNNSYTVVNHSLKSYLVQLIGLLPKCCYFFFEFWLLFAKSRHNRACLAISDANFCQQDSSKFSRLTKIVLKSRVQCTKTQAHIHTIKENLANKRHFGYTYSNSQYTKKYLYQNKYNQVNFSRQQSLPLKKYILK